MQTIFYISKDKRRISINDGKVNILFKNMCTIMWVSLLRVRKGVIYEKNEEKSIGIVSIFIDMY